MAGESDPIDRLPKAAMRGGSGLFVAPLCFLLSQTSKRRAKSITDELTWRGEKDLSPEDLLTVAKICLDLLMRPDKSCALGV